MYLVDNHFCNLLVAVGYLLSRMVIRESHTIFKWIFHNLSVLSSNQFNSKSFRLYDAERTLSKLLSKDSTRNVGQ